MEKLDQLCSIINSEMQSYLRQLGVSEMQSPEPGACENIDPCTVYTITGGDYQIRLVFCAERALLRRIAEGMLGESTEDPEDIRECAMEFFNVVCGRIVAAIFRETRTRARFHCPDFKEGWYIPGKVSSDDNDMVAYCYLSIRDGAAVFMHDPLQPVS